MKAIKQLMIDIKFGKGKILQLFISLSVALAVFVGLIMLQQSLIAPNGLITVIVAKKDIPKNLEITESNYNEYFESKDKDSAILSKSSITNKEDLINTVTSCTLLKGNSISKDNLIPKEKILNNSENLVHFSIAVSSITNAVGGSIRGGDIVDFGIINEVTKEYEYVKEGVYIEKALDASGIVVDKSSSAPATTFIILADKEDMKIIQAKLAIGQLLISKVENIDKIKE